MAMRSRPSIPARQARRARHEAAAKPGRAGSAAARHSRAHAVDAEDARKRSAEFRAHDADAAVVVAYGMILPQAILDAPKLGCFNLHASLLPRWRGAAPINRAIMAGDAETGVMVMKMDAGLDTGDVAMAERLAITDAMTASDLHDALARLGADLMVRAMGALERGMLRLTKQSEAGRHLRRQDRKGRGADRLEQAGARGAAPYSWAVAVSRRLVRDANRRRSLCASKSCAAHWPMARARRANCSTIVSRSPARRARSAFSNCSAPARRR